MHRDLSARLVLALALVLALPATSLAQDAATSADTSGSTSSSSVLSSPTPSVSPASATTETDCTNHADDDGDGLADCADADCFEARECRAGGRNEGDEATCTDWIDNDGDGFVDCDDSDCQHDFIRACRGSARGTGGTGGGAAYSSADDIPELAPGQSVEDLIGTNGDLDGERSDETCADGVDNDNDGRVDCADYGCRFDPQVTVCQSGAPSLRFSVVAGIGAGLTLNYNGAGAYVGNTPDAGFSLLQLRALGPIPFINNSFFLISVRAEEHVRLTFALFQIPLSPRGHYLQINSGSGTLSPNLIVSVARQPLLTPAYYLTQQFEQGNGASAEVGGPIDDEGWTRFRLFGAIGSGESTGNVGGRFYRTEDRNFSYVLGGLFQANFVGRYDRFDSPMLYTPLPLTIAAQVGTKFEQRPSERFQVVYGQALFRFWHFLLRAETFYRYVFDYNAQQASWNVLLGALIVPRALFFAADVGGFYTTQGYDRTLTGGGLTPSGISYAPDQFQLRGALHWYYWRNVAMLSLFYGYTTAGTNPTNPLAFPTTHEIRLETRFRF
jgi:hypothetical protein